METFVVKVFGSEYSVKADSGGERVAKVAKVVDKKMKEIDRQFCPGSTGRTAVLACMNLVDEYLAERRQDTEGISRRVGALIRKLDSVL